jgi:hypothetical protein
LQGAIHTAQVFAPLVTDASELRELEPYGEVVQSIFSEFRKKKALSIPIMGSGLTKDDVVSTLAMHLLGSEPHLLV